MPAAISDSVRSSTYPQRCAASCFGTALSLACRMLRVVCYEGALKDVLGIVEDFWLRNTAKIPGFLFIPHQTCYFRVSRIPHFYKPTQVLGH